MNHQLPQQQPDHGVISRVLIGKFPLQATQHRQNFPFPVVKNLSFAAKSRTALPHTRHTAVEQHRKAAAVKQRRVQQSGLKQAIDHRQITAAAVIAVYLSEIHQHHVPCVQPAGNTVESMGGPAFFHISRWQKEGAPAQTGPDTLQNWFGLDPLRQIWLGIRSRDIPQPVSHGAGILTDEDDYNRLHHCLFTEESLEDALACAREWQEGHERGDYAQWLTLEGFFWFPRTLFGIENHLYAFYDKPELMHRINRELTEYYLHVLERLLPIMKPEFMTFAEDLSYNHGPMISKELFDEFMAPYYRKLIPVLKQAGVRVLIDTDGDVEPLIPWFEEVGIEGVLPLERQAGVDVNRIRRNHPQWIMIGGYDKTIMHLGEEAMRREFERILPAMKSGRYIPSVDHQTPPDVSVEQYRIYRGLLEEYARKAVE